MNDIIIQGTPAWFAARLGKATASRIVDVAAKTKTAWGASREKYHDQLVAERLTGQVVESYSNAAMAWGAATEPEARIAYEFYRDVEVVQIGFVDHPTIAMAGASPDGLLGADGLLEIKCPLSTTHAKTLSDQLVPTRYLTQIQWQLACCGRAYCDFVSFDPRMQEEPMRLFIQRVERDNDRIAELEAIVATFLAEVEAEVNKVRAVYSVPQTKAA